MTVIRPNSISGVTSITAHTQSIEFYKSDGSLSGANLDGVNINTAGILTAANFKTGVSNLHDVGLTLSGGQLDVGSNIKAGNAGVITATAFHGSGANLTGISGFATALSNTPNTFLNDCFKTTFSHTIPNGTQIDITNNETTSGKTVFTRLGQIKVATGATFHVSAGTTFVMDVLGVF